MVAPNGEIDRPGCLGDQVAIVTGGTSGIGRATCVALAHRGARVVVVGRGAERATRVAAEVCATGGSAIGLGLDVRSPRDMERMARLTVSRLGGIDVLVACAGIDGRPRRGRMLPTPVSALAIVDWRDVIETNLRGTFLSNRAVLAWMAAEGSGEIVNVGSWPAAFKGQPFAAAYSASKFAVTGLSEGLAKEARAVGVRVQLVAPGLVDTPLTADSTLSARLGPPLSAERVAEHIVRMVTLPRDIVLTPSRRAGLAVLRHAQASGAIGESADGIRRGRAKARTFEAVG